MKSLLIIVACLTLTTCARLDDNLFNSKKIERYELDHYHGEQDFVLDQDYNIPDSKINLFTLASQTKDEASSTKIQAIYIGDINTISTDTVILYLHGNKWHMDFYWQRAKLLANTNGKNRYGVLLIDYRGYGLSKGQSTEESLYADADAAMKWLKEKGLSNERLIVYGFSMGCFPTVELAAYPRSMSPAKIILEAPYANADAMVQDANPIGIPASYVVNLKIDNKEKIKNVKAPLLWIHGKDDHYCNLETQGQLVYNNYQGTYKESFLIDGADHEDVPVKMGFDKYKEAIGDFILK